MFTKSRITIFGGKHNNMNWHGEPNKPFQSVSTNACSCSMDASPKTIVTTILQIGMGVRGFLGRTQERAVAK